MSQGTFVWNELLTRDVEGAKRFYAAIAGWNFSGMPNGDSTYWVAEHGGKQVAGIMAMPDGMPAHVPAHWFVYLQVDDVDATLTAMEANGGTVMRPPFDVPGVGRLGFINDSTGAGLGLMTPESGA